MTGFWLFESRCFYFVSAFEGIFLFFGSCFAKNTVNEKF